MIKQFKSLKLMPQAVLATLVTVFVVAGITSATSIGTNISTDGSLTVTGTTTIDSGLFYADVTNDRVGVGLTNPDSQFHVYDANGGMIEVSDGGSTRVKISATSTGGYIGTSNNNSFGVRTNNIDQIFILDTTGGSNAMVGIGTTTPQYKLDVVGDINISSSSGYKIGNLDVLRVSSVANGNIFVGLRAGEDIQSGALLNTFVGTSAGANTTTGGANTYLGSGAGQNNTTGHYNTLVGTNAGSYMSTGLRNAFFGYSTGANNASGTDNVFLGYYAGFDATGSGNVFLGKEAGRNEIGSNRLYINNTVSTFPLIYGEFDNNILGFNANVGIGTTTPQTDLHLYDIVNNGPRTRLQGLQPSLTLCDSDHNVSDEKNWDFVVVNGTLKLYAEGDNFSGGGAPLIFNRNGMVMTLTSFPSDIAIGSAYTATTSDSHLYIQGTGANNKDFLTIYDSGDTNDVFIIDRYNNVGIGTSTPEADLHVYGGDTATTTVEFGGSLSTKGACLKLRDNDGAGWTYCTTLDGAMTCSTTSCE